MFGMIKRMINGRFGGLTAAVFSLALLLSGYGIGTTHSWTGIPGVGQASAASAATVSSPANPAAPQSFADLVQKLSPAVVNVKVTKVEKAMNMPMFQDPDGPFGDFFKQFPQMVPQVPENRRVQGTGSGFIISSDGTILTNNHVVEGAKEVTVTVGENDQYKAKVVGRDPKTDLAVLKINPRHALTAAVLGDSDQTRVGDWVLAIGNPFGLNHTVTSGIVSAKGRVIGNGPYDDFIQTDASINPGNSGGPLFNLKGEVIGINTAILAQGQGIGFAIPIDMAKPLIPQLVARGEVTRGYIGVTIQSITPDLAKALNLGETKGALVSEVVPSGPAEKAGIQRGDVIVSFNNKPVEDSRALPLMVAETPVGKTVPISVMRSGASRNLTVKVGQLSSEKTAQTSSIQPTQGKWGLQLKDLDPQMAGKLGMNPGQGALVAGVQSGSPAERAGVQRGDVILEMNRQPVHSASQAAELAAKAVDKEPLLVLVKRDAGNFYLTLTM